MRLFIGIFPPLEVREAALAQARGLPLSGKVRWTRPSNLHLTLKFLGEVPEDLLPRVREALEKACKPYEPFCVRLSGFGSFPSKKRARVLWAGVGRGVEDLVSLSTDLEDALSSAGFPRDLRAYVPHLTLGRSTRQPVGVETKDVSLEVSEFLVREVSLVKSELSEAGAVYSVLESYALSGASGSEADRE